MEELSKISSVMQELGQLITTDEKRFLDIPIYYSLTELVPDNLPDTAIVFEAKPFQLDDTLCGYERILDILIIHNTDYEREIGLRLSKYAEDMVELLKEHMISPKISSDIGYQLEFLQGSEIRAKRNNREDTESYKGSKTLFSSLIILRYFLRY